MSTTKTKRVHIAVKLTIAKFKPHKLVSVSTSLDFVELGNFLVNSDLVNCYDETSFLNLMSSRCFYYLKDVLSDHESDHDYDVREYIFYKEIPWNE